MGGAPAWTGTWHATGRPAGTKASQVPHRALAHDPSLFYSTHRQKCGTRCCCPAAEPPVPREARSSITRVRWVSCGSVPEPMLALIYARQRWAHSRSPTLDQDLVHSRSARWTKAVSSVHLSCCGSCPSCFAGAERQTHGPRCSCSSCNRCSKAEQELQQLVLTVLPKHVATPGPEFWGMALRDLEELVKQGSLSWCCSANDQSEEQRGASACESSDSPVLQPQSPCLL